MYKTFPHTLWRNPVVSTLVNAILIVGSVALCVAMQRYNTSFTYGDECYQYLSVMHYDTSPVAPLSFYIGHLWSLLWGNTLLSMRMLQVLAQAVAIGLGIFYFYRRTHDGRVASLLFAMLMLATKFWSMNIYGWDVGSYPFMMLCLLSSLRYSRRPTMPSALMLAFTFALMCLSRVTLLAGLPFVAALVVWRCRGNVRACVTQLLAGTLLGLVVAAAALSLIYGSVGAYAEVCSPDNVVNGHLGESGLLRFYSRFYNTTLEVVGGWPIGVSALVGTYMVVRARRWRLAVWALTVLALTVVVAALDGACNYFYVFGALHPVLFFLCLYPFYKAVMGGGRVEIPFANIAVLVFAFLPLVGSDSFLVRVLVLPLIPVACATEYARLRYIIRPLTIILLLGLGLGIVRLMRGWQAFHTVDGAQLAPRMAGMKLLSDDFLPPVVELKARYLPDGKVKVIDYNNLAYAYFVDEDLSLSRQLFGFYVFEEDRHLYDRCVADGYDFIVGAMIESGDYRRALIDYLLSNGYECIAVDGKYTVYQKKS